MSDTAPDRLFCGRQWKPCWQGTTADLLRAPDPFNEGEELVACPNCRSGDELTRACDIDGCWKEATCGTPVKDARRYVQVCGDHYREVTTVQQSESHK
jgi:hypothetical protein